MLLIMKGKPGTCHSAGHPLSQSDTLMEHRRRWLGAWSKQGLVIVGSGPENLHFNEFPGDVDHAGPLDHILNRMGLNQGCGPNPASSVFCMSCRLRVVFTFLKSFKRIEKSMWQRPSVACKPQYIYCLALYRRHLLTPDDPSQTELC